jgi:hypothetical protein
VNRPFEDMTDEPAVTATLLDRLVALEAVVREHQTAHECVVSKDRQTHGKAVVAGRRLLDEMEDE